MVLTTAIAHDTKEIQSILKKKPEMEPVCKGYTGNWFD